MTKKTYNQKISEKTHKKMIKAKQELDKYKKGINWHRLFFVLVVSFCISLVLIAYSSVKIGYYSGYLVGISGCPECLTSSPGKIPDSEPGSGSALSPLIKFCLWDESRDDMSKIGDAGEVGALQYMPMTFEWLSEKYGFDGSICSRADQIELFEIAVEGGDGGLWVCFRKYKGIN